MRTGSEVRAAVVDAKNRGLYRQNTFELLAGMSPEDMGAAAVLLDRLESACIEFPHMSTGFDLTTYAEQDWEARTRLAERIGFAFTGTEGSGWESWADDALNDTFIVRGVPIVSFADVALVSLGAMTWVIEGGMPLRAVLDNSYSDGHGCFPG